MFDMTHKLLLGIYQTENSMRGQSICMFAFVCIAKKCDQQELDFKETRNFIGNQCKSTTDASQKITALFKEEGLSITIDTSS